MISHQYQCIFIHIPKCAGTSIENALGHFDGHEGREGQDHRSIRMLQQPLLTPRALAGVDNLKDVARRLREHFRSHANPNNGLMVNPEQYRRYFKFSVVRNPWDRAYSWYQNVQRDPIHQRNYGVDPALNFHDFMCKFGGKGMLRPQTYWLKDFKGAIELDFICRFEQLQSDFQTVCQHLRLDNTALPHKLDSGIKDYRQRMEARTVALIADMYREDIERFGYAA